MSKEAIKTCLELIDLPDSALHRDLVRRLPERAGRITNRTGEKFGKCEVIGFAGFMGKHAAWALQCECGIIFVERSSHLSQSNAPSRTTCGHCSGICADGLRDHPLYRTWRGIIERCFYEKSRNFKWYGARGITMCERWRTSLAAFIEDMGEKPTDAHSIDRINNEGNYEPGNCRWATAKEQAANQRPRQHRKIYSFNGKTQSHTEWARELGLSYYGLTMRIRSWGSIEDALSTPKLDSRLGLKRKAS